MARHRLRHAAGMQQRFVCSDADFVVRRGSFSEFRIRNRQVSTDYVASTNLQRENTVEKVRTGSLFSYKSATENQFVKKL
jgi:hypothetical protein